MTQQQPARRLGSGRYSEHMAKVLATSLISALLASACLAQVVTPRGSFAAIYKAPDPASPFVAEVEPSGRWRLQFTGAKIAARLPKESSEFEFAFLLPARDTGKALLARVHIPGKKDQGWVEPAKVEVSPAPFWKIPANTLLFAPMRARHLPPLRVAPLPAGLQNLPCSYLLLVDTEGKVASLRALEGATDPALESALRQFQFAPMVVDGEPTHVLLAIRVGPRSRTRR